MSLFESMLIAALVVVASMACGAWLLTIALRVGGLTDKQAALLVGHTRVELSAFRVLAFGLVLYVLGAWLDTLPLFENDATCPTSPFDAMEGGEVWKL